jgi:hypothetical protein
MSIKVCIHIGPPKTATSAIQFWLKNNQKLLIEKGFYYPEHSMDDNGVSSGNVLDVFDRSEDKKLTPSAERIVKLKQNCLDNNCHTLVLSSEFFYFQMEELIKYFPQAKFIAYIRFPLDVIESSYNQAVKRHSEVHALGLPKEPNAYHLVLLENMLKKYGLDKFVIRYYEKAMLVDGDIVSDFANVLGVEGVSATSNLINTSYTFEALELKRWLNLFMPVNCQHRVDRFLQSYSNGITVYSLIKPTLYEYYQTWFAGKLTDFFSKYPIEDSQKYLAQIEQANQRPYILQNMSIESFDKIVAEMVKWDPSLVYVLAKNATKSEVAKEKRPDFFDSFCSAVTLNNQVRVRIREFYLSISFTVKKHFRKLFSSSLDTSKLPIGSIGRLRHTLKIETEVTDGEIFRELALYCEQNGEINLAYRLMKEADRLRPNGPVIRSKLAEYQEKLNISMTTESTKK